MTPTEQDLLFGVKRLGLGFIRAANQDRALVLRTVPVILLELDTGAWRTVQRSEQGRGRGLLQLVQFLAH